MYEAVAATEDHVRELVANIRPSDAEEIRALGEDPLPSMIKSLKVSRDPVAVLSDGRVISIFGVGVPSLLSDLGVPWMIGAAELPRHKKALLKASRAWVWQARHEYRYLCNYVDARHHSAIRWLRWMGFAIEAPAPFGPLKMPFHKFDMVGVY